MDRHKLDTCIRQQIHHHQEINELRLKTGIRLPSLTLIAIVGSTETTWAQEESIKKWKTAGEC